MVRTPLHVAPFEKLATHPQYANYLAGSPIAPINVEVSPSGICQASCEFCWYANGDLGGHRKVFLDLAVLTDLITACAEMGVRSITWTGGGDPSLYPSIGAAVAYVAATGMRQGMFTNALAMPRFAPSAMDWIRITMTDKPHNVESIQRMREAKTLGFAFNYSGEQDDPYLRRTLDLAESVKADYVQVRPALPFHGRTVEIHPPNFGHPLMQVTRYKFTEAQHKHQYAECEGYHFVPFVWEDGDVDVCAYMRGHDGYTLGNLYRRDFRGILEAAPKSVPVAHDCQVCCRNHEINRAIHSGRALLDRDFP